jgi:hypothetical protein
LKCTFGFFRRLQPSSFFSSSLSSPRLWILIGLFSSTGICNFLVGRGTGVGVLLGGLGVLVGGAGGGVAGGGVLGGGFGVGVDFLPGPIFGGGPPLLAAY